MSVLKAQINKTYNLLQKLSLTDLI